MSGDPIGDRLRLPTRRVALADLPALWFRHRVQVLAPKPAGFLRDHGLPGRLRGAIGQRLVSSASAEAQVGQPCPWRPASALDPFFVARRLGPGLEIPKPMLPFVEEDRGVLLFGCDVFGFATAWGEAVGEAMVAGLREGLLDARGQRWRFEPLRRDLEELRGFEPPPDGAVAAVLQFATPLCLRHGAAAMDAEAGMAMASIANRASGLARWHDATLEADWTGLAARWRRLTEDRSAMRAERWRRSSARQGGRDVPMVGDSGALQLGRLDPELALLVAAGATTAMGSHTALGLGRYRPAFVVPGDLCPDDEALAGRVGSAESSIARLLGGHSSPKRFGMRG